MYTVVKFSFRSTLTSHELQHMTESKQNLFCSKAYLQIKYELWILNHPHFSTKLALDKKQSRGGREQKRAGEAHSGDKEQKYR